MSAVAVDQGRGFPTTIYGFHASTKGFDIMASTPPSTRSALSASPALHRQLSDGPDVFGEVVSKPRPVAAPIVTEQHVGWKGLLEISRKSGVSGILGQPSSVDDDACSRPSQIEVCATAHTNPSIRRLVKSVIRGLKACQEPERALDGMGGTYFFCNENGRKVAILKPCDEEPLAPNNPKGYLGRALGDPGWKPTVRVGEAAMREVAAYLLDRDGFAKVPTSVLVRARHPIFCYNNSTASVCDSTQDLVAAEAGFHDPMPMKLGSLQEFVPHECDTSEMGPSRFSARDVHRIGILDVRLFNTDRHAGNMLVRTSKESCGNLAARIADSAYELVPIDHGFCLPEMLEAPYFEWLHWPQAMLPFTEDELAYIRALDFEADKELLAKEIPHLRPECVRVLELTTALLKRCADAGMTLYEIGSVMSRPYVDADEDPSELENICERAKQMFEMQEIDEEEEEEGSCCSDEGCNRLDDVDEEDAFADELAGELFEGGGKAAARGSNSASTEDEGMMFDLEEDAAGNVYIKSVSSTFEPQSPSQFSIESSISSADYSKMESNMGGMGGMGGMLPTAAAPAEPVVTRNMARSVHVTDGLLWRMGNQRRPQQQQSKRLRKPKRTSPQAYPPKVVAQGPTSSGSVNFGGFDERGWALFTRDVLRLMDESIRSGKWRQAASSSAGGVAMSCPRF